jgi:PHD/YefM family antitoxin component YafN of YafNO toxin-antitoxin module
MALPNVFDAQVAQTLVTRIQQLRVTTTPSWGKMNVAQMLAHCNVTYEMIYETKHAKPNVLVRFMLKLFVKKIVVTETPYTHNSRTAPQFIIADARDFEKEKTRLIAHIQQTQKLGAPHFEGKESHSFGALTTTEWNNMFYKHLDHHFKQFGV